MSCSVFHWWPDPKHLFDNLMSRIFVVRKLRLVMCTVKLWNAMQFQLHITGRRGWPKSLRIQSLTNRYDEKDFWLINYRLYFSWWQSCLRKMRFLATEDLLHKKPCICLVLVVQTKYKSICNEITASVGAFSHFNLFRYCAEICKGKNRMKKILWNCAKGHSKVERSSMTSHSISLMEAMQPERYPVTHYKNPIFSTPQALCPDNV